MFWRKRLACSLSGKAADEVAKLIAAGAASRGGCQLTKGMRRTNSSSTQASMSSVFERNRNALAKSRAARGLTTMTSMRDARWSARAKSRL